MRVQTSVTLDIEAKERISAYCQEKGISVSRFFEQAALEKIKMAEKSKIEIVEENTK